MARARWTALAMVAALAIGAIGCGSGESGTTVKKIAFVAPYQDNDPDWTLQAKTAVEAVARALGVEVQTVDAAGRSAAAVLRQASHDGVQLVIAHDSRYAAAAEAVARATHVPELVWGEGGGATGSPVGHLTVQDKEGGYMAGIVASHAAYSRRLAVVVVDDGSAWDLATWNRTAGGFIAGARSADPHVHLQYTQVGSGGHATAAQARAAVNHMLARGAQMTLILGGREAIGAQRAIEATGGSGERLSISVVTNKASTRRLEETGVPIMLGSIMWNVRPAVRQAVADLRAGRFGKRPYALTLANGGVWLEHTGRMPQDAYELAMAAKTKMAAGTLHVPVTPTSEAVQALLASGRSS